MFINFLKLLKCIDKEEKIEERTIKKSLQNVLKKGY